MYLQDGMGSVSSVVSGGQVAASYTYSPWGEELQAAGALSGREGLQELPHYGYNAEQSSPAGGLQYLRARWYDASMGAFGSRDSYLGDAADPASLNRYAYAGGNPVAYADPTGHAARRRSMASLVAASPLYGVRAWSAKKKAAAAPPTVTGAFSHAIANARKPPSTITGSFSNVVAAGSAQRRRAVERAPYSSYPNRLGSSAILSRGRQSATRCSSYRQGAYGASSRIAAAVRRQFCGTAERQRDYGITPTKGSVSDVLHVALGFAGQIPAIGEPFDFADGIVSFLEGDVLGGLLSFGAMATGPGAVSGAAKTADRLSRLGKAGKTAKEVADLSKAAGKVDLSSGLVRQTVDIDDIVDGQAMTTSEALDLALSYLGPGYKDMGNGRYVSADGLRQFRMGINDIEGHHWGAPHVNFEVYIENPRKPGRLTIDENRVKHVRLTDVARSKK